MLTCAGCGRYIAGEYWHEGCATPPSEKAPGLTVDVLARALYEDDDHSLGDIDAYRPEAERIAAEYARLTASDGGRE
jgi:hypothetical protein